jgi:hypothetical protein
MLINILPGTTNCFLPAGGGPDPNQCHVIADALRFNSENTGRFLLHRKNRFAQELSQGHYSRSGLG